jgi:hypothetical protein
VTCKHKNTIVSVGAEWCCDCKSYVPGCTSCGVFHKRIDELKAALEDAIDLAVEGWSYASFREKWDSGARLSELRAALKGGE